MHLDDSSYDSAPVSPCNSVPKQTDWDHGHARRFAAITFAGLPAHRGPGFATIFGWPHLNSCRSPRRPSYQPPSTPAPQPDKGRAKNAFQAGRRAEQSGDWKAEFAAYTEAVTYDPSNREYAMLKEHARFQVIRSLVDSAERQAIAGNIPSARAVLTRGSYED